jgi:hypothetical protein
MSEEHRCPTCGGEVEVVCDGGTTNFYRPVEPTKKTKPKSKPARTLPDEWAPTDEHRERALKAGINAEHEAMKFRAHAEANDRRQVNWNAAFTTWLLNAEDWSKRSNGFAPKPKGDPYEGKFVPRHRHGEPTL